MAGIDLIRFQVPRYVLELADLAAARGVDPAKYRDGLGQERMAVAPPDEDAITLGAAAAQACLAEIDPGALDAVILATESGIDQAKAGALFIHRLLGLGPQCRAFEIKQSCCGSTVALQIALDRVAARPDRRVLVVASDVARYGLGTPGEPTQGAGAAAFVVSAAPRLLAFEPATGQYTEDVMDFWRPNYRDEALVDGRFSIRMYLTALTASWAAFRRDGGCRLGEIARCCYHQPFTQLAVKAHAQLRAASGAAGGPAAAALAPGLAYHRVIGNTYTAALYVSLASLFEQEPADLTGQRVGLFSYGSGCMGAFFTGVVQPGYRRWLARAAHERQLAERQVLSVAEYEAFHGARLPEDGGEHDLPTHTRGPFRLAGIRGHRRQYVRVTAGTAG